MLTHFSLFTGIGGLDLAAEMAGFQTVGQCEWADYPTKVLEKHWPDVPRWRDIRDVTKASVRERGIGAIDVISGGFPCQPFSVAGNQKGKEDDRYLWPEMLRVIRELTPCWVVGENVPGILSIAADEVCSDLDREGYEVGMFNFEAAAVGAMHRRGRVFFVGHSKHNGLYAAEVGRGNPENARESKEGAQPAVKFTGAGKPRSNEDVAYANSAGFKEFNTTNQPAGPGHDTRGATKNVYNTNSRGCSGDKWREYEVEFKNGCWWAVEPELGRVANGIPSRVDRLKCLGNAVVPQQAYPIFRAIEIVELLS